MAFADGPAIQVLPCANCVIDVFHGHDSKSTLWLQQDCMHLTVLRDELSNIVLSSARVCWPNTEVTGRWWFILMGFCADVI